MIQGRWEVPVDREVQESQATLELQASPGTLDLQAPRVREENREALEIQAPQGGMVSQVGVFFSLQI